MSYLFAARGTTKAAALEQATAKFKEVVNQQPIHAQDEAAAQKCREEAAALLGEAPEGKDYYISCSGSLSWEGTAPDHRITGASINVYVSHQPKEPNPPVA